MQPANLRYLDEIQEEGRTPRAKKGLIAVLSCALLAVAFVVTKRAPPTAESQAASDPLGELIRQAKSYEPPPARKLASLPSVDGLARSFDTEEQSEPPLVAPAKTQKKEPEAAEPGHEGGFQIQVASLREMAKADALVIKLRRSGHHAYRQAAWVPKRGLWHRVRIGPFYDKLEAERYRDRFQVREGMSTLLIEP